jgi:hypothetical protein
MSSVSFDAALEETLRSETDESRKAAGLKIGRAAAAAILAARKYVHGAASEGNYSGFLKTLPYFRFMTERTSSGLL